MNSINLPPSPGKTLGLFMFIFVTCLITSCQTNTSEEENENEVVDAVVQNSFEPPEGWKTHTFDNELSMQFPDSLDVLSASGEKLVCKYPCDEEIIFCANFNATAAFKTREETTVDILGQNLIEKIGSEFTDGFALVDAEKDSTEDSSSLTFHFKMIYGGRHFGGTSAVFLKNNSILIVNFMSKNEPQGEYQKFIQEIDPIINSIH